MTDIFSRALQSSSATLHEALSTGGPKRGALPSAIRALTGQRICGPAFPVQCEPGSNLQLHRAILAAPKGAVLVADVQGADEHGYWGEVMAVAAQVRQLGGLVINGGVRDVDAMARMDFPVFARMACIRGTSKKEGGQIGEPITIGDVTIIQGDLVFGDSDGVVILPKAEMERAVTEGIGRDREEGEIFERLRKGESTLDIYRLPPAPETKG